MKKSSFLIILLLLLSFVNVFAQEQPFKITHGPYLQDMSETGMTLLWTTNRDAIAWVETAPDDSTHFYLKERPKYFSEENGFKKVSSVHSVRIDRLQPGTRYRYRIYSQEVLSHQETEVLYGKAVASDVFRSKPFGFVTNDITRKNISFVMLNDIHERNEVMENLLKGTDWQKTDLVLFNGDMVNNLRSEEQMFGGFMDTAVRLFAGSIPMYYARGNHETRGNFATAFADYFPGPWGNLYYLFRQGPVCFVVLDCGEDKPDSDIEYSGIVAFDAYREKEAQWLKEALLSDTFKNAPYKVVVAHIPPFGGWHGEQEVAERFVPLLNAAGADVMLCGHLHRYVRQNPKPGQDFPVIVNSNNTVLKAHADKNALKIDILNLNGKLVDSLEIHPE